MKVVSGRATSELLFGLGSRPESNAVTGTSRACAIVARVWIGGIRLPRSISET